MLSSIILILSLVTQQCFAKDEVIVRGSSAGTEEYQRDVDEVAIASQQKAIAKLMPLIKKYKNTRQEPILLAKLAELQQQSAAIRFRIAHGVAHKNKQSLDLRQYKKEMLASTATLTDLITRYPSYEEMAHAYFLRAKAYEEVEQKAKATADYLHLVKDYPNAEEVILSYMSLAEFAIDANNHPQAIQYLNEVEKYPDDPHYPFALYKLAWSYYNLKNVARALAYTEKYVAYQREYKAKQANSADGVSMASLPAGTSDEALLENMLLDSTVFFFEGYEQGLPEYKTDKALPYFKSLEKGPVLGRMLVKYAKLLRSHTHDADLLKWKNDVVDSESDRPESLDVVLTSFEYQLNNRNYNQIEDHAKDLVKLYNKHKEFESFPKAHKFLLEAAEKLQATILKNKSAQGVGSLSNRLATIYDTFTRIVNESDPRIPRVHYNLAEVLFEIKDFDQATSHYRWIVEHKNRGGLSANDAATKAVASRYESLRIKKTIPEKLSPKKLSADRDKKMEDALEPVLREWIEWVDEEADKSENRNNETIENFYFEANRTLYANNLIKLSTERMRKFSSRYPKSRYAIPSASLVLDTYIAGSEWNELHEVANSFLDIEAWSGTPFSKRLFQVAADAFYKMIEIRHKESDYAAVVKQSDRFLDRYASSQRLGDCLILAGSSALALGDRKRANEYFSRVVSEIKDTAILGNALFSRAQISEDRYDFTAATRDYQQFLTLPETAAKLGRKGTDQLRRKTLALSWLAGGKEFQNTIASAAVCAPSVVQDCDHYQALLALMQQKKPENLLERAKSASESNRALWAALALENAKQYSYRERLYLIRQLASHWDDLDSLTRFYLVPSISVSLPNALQLNRVALAEVAPLRASERYIKQRIEAMKELENAATQAMKLPWSRIRALVLNEMADLYLDLSNGIRNLPTPKGLNQSDLQAYEDTITKLVVPFEEKGQDIRRKAFEIASRFAIDTNAFNTIATQFFQDNPSQAKALKREMAAVNPPKIAFDLLPKLDSEGNWNRLKETSSDPSIRIKSMWAKALKQKQWQQVAFFLQEAQEKALVLAGSMGLLKAVSLAEAGAQAEALAEIEEVRGDLTPSARRDTNLCLLSYYLGSLSKDKTKTLIKELRDSEEPNSTPPQLVTQAVQWMGK